MNTSTATVVDSVLAGLVQSYETIDAPQKMVRLVRNSDAKPKKEKKAFKAPSDNGVKPIRMVPAPLAILGSLDAEGFILALRGAGKIHKANDKGVMVAMHDPNKAVLDQKIAIAAYLGYDLNKAHGTQLDQARQKAQFTLRPSKGDSRVAHTVAGFVAGMPDSRAKQITDLQARIRVATETMLDLEKEAEAATDETIRATKLTLATVESERIAHMRKDLARLS